MPNLHTQHTYREMAERLAAAHRLLLDTAAALHSAAGRELTAEIGNQLAANTAAETAADLHHAEEHARDAAEHLTHAYATLTGRELNETPTPNGATNGANRT